MSMAAEEERRIDPHCGYPRLFAKLCRDQGSFLFSEGPPKNFLPYAARLEDVPNFEQLEKLFPVVNREPKDSRRLQEFKEVLWQKLDHLGKAGFDPASLRVDAFGNVLYWHADPASPLAWDVCHWFPYSRGGETVENNLRIVQWQVKQKRDERLEFLVPWWDLQLGVSVNQFLSAFESTNISFRQRFFSYLFPAGYLINGNICEISHEWPYRFLEKKKGPGLAAAALVSSSEKDVLKPIDTNSPAQDVRAAKRKSRFGNWKESERALFHLQTPHETRSLAELDKENFQPSTGHLQEWNSPDKENCQWPVSYGHYDEQIQEVKLSKQRESSSQKKQSVGKEVRKHKKQVPERNESHPPGLDQETIHPCEVLEEETSCSSHLESRAAAKLVGISKQRRELELKSMTTLSEADKGKKTELQDPALENDLVSNRDCGGLHSYGRLLEASGNRERERIRHSGESSDLDKLDASVKNEEDEDAKKPGKSTAEPVALSSEQLSAPKLGVNTRGGVGVPPPGLTLSKRYGTSHLLDLGIKSWKLSFSLLVRKLGSKVRGPVERPFQDCEGDLSSKLNSMKLEESLGARSSSATVLAPRPARTFLYFSTEKSPSISSTENQ